MSFIAKSTVRLVISDAILKRSVLNIKYQHTSDGEIVNHKLAPFDIGSTNPKTSQKNADMLYAYSYTHLNEKTNRLDPKVCAFNINNFIVIDVTEEVFDESELAKLNLEKTRYDYRACNFALVPDRKWFS